MNPQQRSIGRPPHDARQKPAPQESLAARVHTFAQRQPWVQDIRLPGGIRTRADIPDKEGSMVGKWRRLEPIFDALELDGKRVLDVGCNEGFFSIEAEQRGAKVHGIDLDPMRIEKARFVAEILESRSRFDVMNIYGDEFSKLGDFDVALAIGMIHRLPDPLSALERIVKRADISVLEWKTFHWGPYQSPYAYYVEGRNAEGEILHPKHWRLSPACVEAILKDLGYDRFRRVDNGRTDRTLLVAGRIDHDVFTPKKGDIVPPARMKRLKRATRDYLYTLKQVATGH